MLCSIDLCPFLCQYNSVLVTVTLYCSLTSGSMILSVLFFLWISLSTWVILCFHTNFRITCCSTLNITLVFWQDCLWICWFPWVICNMFIIIILTFLVHEHVMSFPLFVLSFFFFKSASHTFLSTCLLLPWLIRFIAWNFILFYVMINGIGLLISLSDSLFLLFRNGTDFCTLIFYPTIVPNSFMSSRRLLLGFLEFWTARSPTSSS